MKNVREFYEQFTFLNKSNGNILNNNIVKQVVVEKEIQKEHEFEKENIEVNLKTENRIIQLLTPLFD